MEENKQKQYEKHLKYIESFDLPEIMKEEKEIFLDEDAFVFTKLAEIDEHEGDIVDYYDEETEEIIKIPKADAKKKIVEAYIKEVKEDAARRKYIDSLTPEQILQYETDMFLDERDDDRGAR